MDNTNMTVVDMKNQQVSGICESSVPGGMGGCQLCE